MSKSKTFLLILTLFACITTANAGGDTQTMYYAKLHVQAGATGNGYVYGDAKTTAPANTAYLESKDVYDYSYKTEDTTAIYYAWAKPCRGVKFNGWTLTGAGTPTLKTDNKGIADVITMQTGTSDGTTQSVTNEAYATAQWQKYMPCEIHLHSSPYGSYRVQYEYTDYNTTLSPNQFVDYNDSVLIDFDAAETQLQAYCTDKVTLKVLSGELQGWYQDQAYTTELDSVEKVTDAIYTYTPPDSTVQSTIRYIYPKFKEVDRYYSKLNIKYASYSAEGAGSLAVNKYADALPAYSLDECNLSQVSLTQTNHYYYLSAKPNNQQYTFIGWFSTQTPSLNALISTNANYVDTLLAQSKDENNPTEKTIYALFLRIYTHYSTMTAEPVNTGLGMVYVSLTEQTNPDYSLYSNYSKALAEEMGLTDKKVTTNFYLYAKPKYGYKFEGWYSDASGTTQVSTDNPYKYTDTINSTDPNNPDSTKLYAKFVWASPINVTFTNPTTAGSYSVKALDIVVEDDEYVWGETTELFKSVNGTSSDKTISIYPTSDLTLTATPEEGYSVKSWTIASNTIKTGLNIYHASATANMSYGVTFGKSSPFKVGDNTYATLDLALTAAIESETDKTIIVVEDACIQAGTYTIPSDITLLIPYSTDYAVNTTSPSRSRDYASPTPYITLTLSEGVTINLNGSICVNAQQYAAGTEKGRSCGGVNGPYGKVIMNQGSHIILNSNSNLYCWGFITGEGVIDALSDSKVYESFQFTDWRGGSATSSLNNNQQKVFFLSQYFIQNIECYLQYHKGTEEFLSTAVYALSSINQVDDMHFIGIDEGLFRLVGQNAVVTRKYNSQLDRINYSIADTTKLGAIKLTVLSIPVSSENYVCPVTFNMSIDIIKEAYLSIDNEISILPGAELQIEEGATCAFDQSSTTDTKGNTITKTGMLYVYDKDDWKKDYMMHKDIVPVYSPTKTFTRTINNSLNDAKIIVNGTLNLKKGGLYTTSNGANICSTGRGNIIFNTNAVKDSITYQAFQSGSTITYDPISITPAILLNNDSSYISTAQSVPTDSYTYFCGVWTKNLKMDGCFTVDDAGHKYIEISGGYKDVTQSDTYTAAWQCRDAASVLFIHTDATCDWVEVNVVENSTTCLKDNNGQYYQYDADKGYWVSATQYTVTFQNYNNKTLSTYTILPNSTPKYTGATPVHPSNGTESYEFSGWQISDGATIYASNQLPALSDNTTFVAQFKSNPYVASVTSLDVTSNYTTFADALAQANEMTTNPTLKLLTNVSNLDQSQSIEQSMTIDLNGYSLSGTVTELLKVNAADIDVTITDNSENRQGSISATGSLAAGNFHTISVAKGNLTLDGGTIYGQNTDQATVYVVNIENDGTFQMNDGCITTTATTDNPQVNGLLTSTSKTTLSAGTISVLTSVVCISDNYSANDSVTISGGFFKGETVVDKQSSAKVKVIGGHFSTNTNLSNYTPSPYHVINCDEEQYKDTYPYEVSDSYVLTWDAADGVLSGTYTSGKTKYGTAIQTPIATREGYEFQGWDNEPASTMPAEDVTYTAQWLEAYGPVLDIVRWTADSLTINATAFPLSGWSYVINGVSYGRNDATTSPKCNPDRTVTIPYSGNPDGQWVIKVTNSSNTLYSHHAYTIPHIYSGNVTLSGTKSTSTVFVNAGNLTIAEPTTLHAIYVSDSAQLTVNANLVVDSLFLRTTAWTAAVLQNNATVTATNAYYTRIVADNSQYFQFAIPLSSDVNSVTLSNRADCPYGTTWLLKSYNETSRANNGDADSEDESNWDMLPAEPGTIEGTRGYELYSLSKYYREFYFPVTLPSTPQTEVALDYTQGTADKEHWGWNALCSPLLGIYKQTFSDPSDAIKVSKLQPWGRYQQYLPDSICPAVPFYYQAPSAKTLDFSGDEMILKAPLHEWQLRVSTQWLRLTLSDQAGQTLDETNIFTHPDKFTIGYEPGYDVTKLSLQGGKALLYSELPCGKLAFAAVPDSLAKTLIPLTVYADNQEYFTFHLSNNAYHDRLTCVLLCDLETGAVTDLLQSDYTTVISAGTVRNRFYITCLFTDGQDIVTDLDNVLHNGSQQEVRKILYNDHIYIIRNGLIYDITGRQCQLQ